ncbi:MAG: hypothetical protein UW63_C0093G0008 [Candidatus Uhrbacteria bacterium GW2011_GWF2_44_350]|uniref:Uncharacterized protein n=1 Tax=Candidatus Uhrbacteria bacterium GW2011_GWF2_44_350 TaxID=1619000 RepID=A0A0G1J963_9BACT|nr:MAG: hypothetical protein UW63_C0093G0008 [Candidatus Uhrbacteria bacterium GW2011_GWF2_44_350]
MTTKLWVPCEVGQRLYEEYIQLAEKVLELGYYTIDPNQPILIAWRAWVSHRDGCKKCGGIVWPRLR